MDIEALATDDDVSASQRLNRLWPLDEVNPEKARFPCCIVWTPLPIVSWLAPYIGHVGIGREDGQVLDFAGSNFVNTDNFSYGAVARYLQLDREQDANFSRQQAYLHGTTIPYCRSLELAVYWCQCATGQPTRCCFPPNLSAHKCKQSYKHAENGVAISWDDALHWSMQHFQHKYYNLFTCNCHSFVADCLNRLAYNGSVQWNMLNLAALILRKGQWVDGMSVFRSFSPFVVVLIVGILMAGWPFLVGMATFSFLLIGWFILRIYCMKVLD